MNKNGVINEGNTLRIKNAMVKAMNGKPVTVSFIGGSITMGSGSSNPTSAYAYLVYEWWQKKFTESTITYLNAGIGATDSRYGAARIKEQVLDKNVDFVLAEFAVNDENEPQYIESMEGLVRNVLGHKSAPGFLILANTRYDSGISAEKMHLNVARHYNVPIVSIKKTIYSAIENGEISSESVSEDMLHPNDLGHKLVSEVVIDFLEDVYDDVMSTTPGQFDTTLIMPEPLTLNRYENCLIINRNNFESEGVKTGGFCVDTREKKAFDDIFSEGFKGTSLEDTICLETRCRSINIQYRRTINKPAPLVMVTVDGDMKKTVILDGNFDETWGDKLVLTNVGSFQESGLHKVKIRVVETHEDDREPFYLAAFIIGR